VIGAPRRGAVTSSTQTANAVKGRMKARMRKELLTTLFLAALLAAAVTTMPVKAETSLDGSVEASPPAGNNHFDINFVTKRGTIDFESFFEGSTTPTVPPFYWHDDFESGLGKWSQMVSGAGKIATVLGKGIEGSTGVEVYQTSDVGDTVLYASIYAPGPGIGRVIFWFYDDTSVTGTQVVDVLKDTASLLYEGKALLIGINSYLTSNYVYRVYPESWVATGIPRSGGWHKIEFIADGSTVIGKIDGTQVASTNAFGSFNFIEIGSYWSISGPGLYYDDVTVLGPTGPGQSWVDDGPLYTETRTMSGPVTGPVISGLLSVSTITTLNVTTGSGETTGTWTLTGATGGFAGTLSAGNTNFGELSGTFVSTSGSGFYTAQSVSGTFTGYFYESYSGSGYDSFNATLTGSLTNPNEVLVGKYGTYHINFQWGSYFAILDDDATDDTPGLVQIPGGPSMTGWYYEIYDQPRGKPETWVKWFYEYFRNTGKPVWYAHFGPARGSGMYFNFRLHWDTYPDLWPGWSTDLVNSGSTNLATRWYYYDTYATAEP
jgi:hypothetical protein